ncbi:hypothetical protein [Mycoplasmopsis cricetuli]|uniref:hypothetical protein n=1 Tax=Mycoplasmopsis cricetuli TaxID=171283 RepID=UPI00046EAF1B|nr:hypothetical protein [Mycoplasmopsis cricetuli]
MKISNLELVKSEQLQYFQPGFAISSLLVAIPALINVIAPIVGLIKSTLSVSGEIKDKNSTFKWDNSKVADSKTSLNLNKYISF